MKHNAVIKPNGSLVIRNRNLFDEAIRSFAREKDLDVTIEVKPKKKYVTDPQKAYYFGVVVYLITQELRQLGHDVDKDLVHNFLKTKFLYTEVVNEKTGEFERIPKKMPDCSTSEFIDYVEGIKIWAAEFFGLNIPDAGEQLEIE